VMFPNGDRSMPRIMIGLIRHALIDSSITKKFRFQIPT
jgi:hypothetical protein